MRDQGPSGGATLTARHLSKVIAKAEDGLRDVLAGEAIIPAT